MASGENSAALFLAVVDEDANHHGDLPPMNEVVGHVMRFGFHRVREQRFLSIQSMLLECRVGLRTLPGIVLQDQETRAVVYTVPSPQNGVK